MKNIKKTLIILGILLSLKCYSQAGKLNSYFVTEDGQKVYYDNKDVNRNDNGNFYSKIEGGENNRVEVKKSTLNQKVNQKIIKEPGILYIVIDRSLCRVVAFNEKYVLIKTSIGNAPEGLRVLDRNYKPVGKLIPMFKTMGDIMLEKTIRKNIEAFDEEVLPYFKDCPVLTDAIKSSIKGAENLVDFTANINYYNCNNSPELYDGEIIEDNEVKLSSSKEQSNYGINKAGGKVHFTSSVVNRVIAANKGFQYFFNDDGKIKSKTSSDKDWDLVVLGKKVMISIDSKELIDIVAFNDKYILATKWGTRSDTKWDTRSGFFYGKKIYRIYSREKELLQSDISRDNLNEVISKYFGDCVELKEKVKSNILRGAMATDNIDYYNCNNAKDIIVEIKK